MYRQISPAPARPAGGRPPAVRGPHQIAEEVATMLAAMTYEERIRAYRRRIFTPRELAIAAARLPEEMPMLNGELEWIAYDLE